MHFLRPSLFNFFVRNLSGISGLRENMNDYVSMLDRLVCGAGEAMVSGVEAIKTKLGDDRSCPFLFLVSWRGAEI